MFPLAWLGLVQRLSETQPCVRPDVALYMCAARFDLDLHMQIVLASRI